MLGEVRTDLARDGQCPDDEQREAEREQHVLHAAAQHDTVRRHDEQDDTEQRDDAGAAERERTPGRGVAHERAAGDERDGRGEDPTITARTTGTPRAPSARVSTALTAT